MRAMRKAVAQMPAEEVRECFSSLNPTLRTLRFHLLLLSTRHDSIGDPLGQQLEVFDGREDGLHVAEHGGEAQAEEHGEEQHGPYLRARHLHHRLAEHDERQAGARCALGGGGGGGGGETVIGKREMEEGILENPRMHRVRLDVSSKF